MLHSSPSSPRPSPGYPLPAQGWAAHRTSQDQGIVFTQADQVVWDDHLSGLSARSCAVSAGLSARRVRALLAGTPPAPLDQDPRFLTGRRPFWLSQQGARPLESSPGAPYPFLLAFFPIRFPQAVFRRAVRSVERYITERHGLSLSVGWLNEPLPFALAHRFATARGTPCWTVDAEGAVSVGPPAWTPPEARTS